MKKFFSASSKVTELSASPIHIGTISFNCATAEEAMIESVKRVRGLNITGSNTCHKNHVLTNLSHFCAEVLIKGNYEQHIKKRELYSFLFDIFGVFIDKNIG